MLLGRGAEALGRRGLGTSGRAGAWSQQKLRLKLVDKHKAATRPAQAQPRHYEERAAAMPLDKRYLTNLSLLWKQRDAVARDVHFRKDDRIVGVSAATRLPDLPPDAPRLRIGALPGYDSAPDVVKDILSVRCGNRDSRRALWRAALLEEVREDPLDDEHGGSIPARMAALTVRIRDLSAMQTELALISPKKPYWIKEELRKAIERRRELAAVLRERDAAKAEEVEAKLGLDFSAAPAQLDSEEAPPATRFQWVQQQVEARVAAEKAERLEAYRLEMEAEREEFLGQKAKRSAEIQARLAELRQELAVLEKEEPAQLYSPSTVDTHKLNDRIHRQFFDMDGNRI